MLMKPEIDRIIERIVARTQPQKIIIFGSYAKGTATIKSDLDILVVKDTELPMINRAADLLTNFHNALIPVDVHIYTTEEVEEYAKEPFSFINTILKSGNIVFEK